MRLISILCDVVLPWQRVVGTCIRGLKFPLLALGFMTLESLQAINFFDSFAKEGKKLLNEGIGKVQQVGDEVVGAVKSKAQEITSPVKTAVGSIITPELRNVVNRENPYRDLIGHVRYDYSLGPDETKFRAARESSIQKAFSALLNKPVVQVPRVGLVLSGGGYRAMTLSLGYMMGLEKIGLADGLMYVSTLSGSTWFLSRYITTSSAQQLCTDFRRALSVKNWGILETQIKQKFDPTLFVNDVLWPKFVFDQPFSSVDLYGGLLADVIFEPFGVMRQRQRLSEQRRFIQAGQKPFPLYTAVEVYKRDDYHWCEFNPYLVSNSEAGLAVDTYAWGRRFNQGQSIDFAPEQSMGFLMGIFGSAFTIKATEIKKIMQESTKRASSTIDFLKLRTAQEIFSIISDTPVGSKRFIPGKVWNPFYNMPALFALPAGHEALRTNKYAMLVDAGIDFNIPLPPLLKKSRDVNIIIIADSSGDARERTDLHKALLYAKRNGFVYERVDDKQFNNFGIYRDKRNSQAPVIIYVNFIKEEKLLKYLQNDSQMRHLINSARLVAFDDKKCLADGYCKTSNLGDYTLADFDQLVGVGEFAIRAHRDQILNVLAQVVR